MCFAPSPICAIVLVHLEEVGEEGAPDGADQGAEDRLGPVVFVVPRKDTRNDGAFDRAPNELAGDGGAVADADEHGGKVARIRAAPRVLGFLLGTAN